MRNLGKISIILLLLLLWGSPAARADQRVRPQPIGQPDPISAGKMHRPAPTHNKNTLMIRVNGTDTTYYAQLPTLHAFAPFKFKNKRQEQFYWRTVRDVKKTLPYAKMIAREIIRTDQELAKIPDKKDRKKYMNAYEKEVFRKYKTTFTRMTISQGEMLMKLIERECNRTSYDLIKMYRGSISAWFWQGVAKMFGNSLKVEYDGADKDKIIERVIILVESGQL